MGIGGFFKGLGKIAMNVVPALFTGGASLPATTALTTGGKILNVLGKAAPIAQGIAGGMQKGREGENTAAEDAASFKLRESGQHEQGLMGRADLDLKQRALKQDHLERAYDLARKSALAKNLKDVTVGGVPRGVNKVTFSGGMRPSAFGQEGMDAANEMHQQAMRALVSGEQFNALPALERIAPAEYKKPGFIENLAGGVGMVGAAKNQADAAREQSDFQARIAAAIEALSGKGAAAKPSTTMDPRLAGVTPFLPPPKGKLLAPDEDGDLSNR